MPNVDPKILKWARETAGLEIMEAAKKIGLAGEQLEKLELGDANPTTSRLLKMAKVYRRPVLTFYMDYIPRAPDLGADFRGLTEEPTSRERALVEALLQSAKASQQLIRSTLELEEEDRPRAFVGHLRRKWDLPKGNSAMQCALRKIAQDNLENLREDAVDGLKLILGNHCSRDHYYAQSNALHAFNLIRDACEKAGIFVILRGNLGSSHSTLSTDLFRAFVIADKIAPFIVINSQDTHPARSFSLLHELVHILLDQSGISDLGSDSPIEHLCNRAAGEWLLPSEWLRDHWDSTNAPRSDPKESISAIANEHHLSHTMVALRLLQNDLISNQTFRQLKEFYMRAWEESRQQEREKRKARKDGGPSFYAVRRSHLGNATLDFAKRMIQAGSLSVTKAAILMSVRSSQVNKLLEPSSK